MEVRKSKKRDAIYEILCGTVSHPTAEWIYARLKPDFPHLSLGTVYRNLTAFKNDGICTCVATVHGQERFDANTMPHAHFICRKCSSVIDMHDVELPEIPSSDYEIDEVSLCYYGLCPNCTNENQ